MHLCSCLCTSQNTIRQISGFVFLMFLFMLMFMSQVFSLAYACAYAYALLKTSLYSTFLSFGIELDTAGFMINVTFMA